MPLPRQTPMMTQYHRLKAAHPGCLLFFRLGDFYELFFDDAQAAAPALDIALTARGKTDGEAVPMCGVPVHSADSYVARLIQKGFKVAICEQTESPEEAKKRGGKPLVQREVIRVVTPGTLTEDSLLAARRHNYLAALCATKSGGALAWLDISTGDFAVMALEALQLSAELARLDPAELLVSEETKQSERFAAMLTDLGARVSPLPQARFAPQAAERRLCAFFAVATLEAFGTFSKAEMAALGVLLDYVETTQKGALPALNPPSKIDGGHYLLIDPATRRNLELSRTLDGRREGSLLDAIDLTLTAGGGRLLAERLAQPSTALGVIEARLNAVEAFVAHSEARETLRAGLRACPDLARAHNRLAVQRGGPRDLANIAQALTRARAIDVVLAEAPALAPLSHATDGADTLIDGIEAALIEEPPALLREGGYIREGYHAELDSLRDLHRNGRQAIVELQARYQRETGVGNLKIKHNNLIGYHVEVAIKDAARLPDDFIQRQSMANATRFTTTVLSELASDIAAAETRALALERTLFDGLVGQILAQGQALRRRAAFLAEIDIACALAQLAVERDYVRPEIEDSTALCIEAGRHPVVERALSASGDAFIANDCDLTEGHLWLLTGPNMAGKSTFLRQNALIVLLAQMGGFVPAKRARIGIVDRLFSRVGAADDLARGRSTFMVEMIETAMILHQASARSLVILDEIGRGTATFDGLSIAWAVVEHLHNRIRARCLFATHYHELTVLADKLSELRCHTMQVKEWQGTIRFLHQVAPGTADRSYGVHVARLAGLPKGVTRRAEKILQTLQAGDIAGARGRLADEMPLFALAADPSDKEETIAAPDPEYDDGPDDIADRDAQSGPTPVPSERNGVAAHDAPQSPDPLRALLAELQPDHVSPREALAWLYRLKQAAENDD